MQFNEALDFHIHSISCFSHQLFEKISSFILYFFRRCKCPPPRQFILVILKSKLMILQEFCVGERYAKAEYKNIFQIHDMTSVIEKQIKQMALCVFKFVVVGVFNFSKRKLFSCFFILLLFFLIFSHLQYLWNWWTSQLSGKQVGPSKKVCEYVCVSDFLPSKQSGKHFNPTFEVG